MGKAVPWSENEVIEVRQVQEFTDFQRMCRRPLRIPGCRRSPSRARVVSLWRLGKK